MTCPGGTRSLVVRQLCVLSWYIFYCCWFKWKQTTVKAHLTLWSTWHWKHSCVCRCSLLYVRYFIIQEFTLWFLPRSIATRRSHSDLLLGKVLGSVCSMKLDFSFYYYSPVSLWKQHCLLPPEFGSWYSIKPHFQIPLVAMTFIRSAIIEVLSHEHMH